MRNAIALMLVLLFVCGCASRPDRETIRRPSGYDAANQLFQSGQLDEAHTGFVCIGQQGTGYELAWHSAGLTSIAQAEGAADALSAGLIERGLEEFARAANAGWSASQAELVRQYAALETDAALERAAYWLAVYRSNPRDETLGIERFSASEIRNIEALIGQQRLEAGRIEAQRFLPQMLDRIDAGDDCQPWLNVRGNRPQGDRPRPRERVERRRGG